MHPEPDETRLEMLAISVARGRSLRQAAKASDVAETTARRWAAEKGFKDRVATRRAEIIGQATGRLSRLAGKAADTLGDLLDAKHEPEIRLKAARAVLQDLLAVREHAELNERLALIEERMANSGHAAR
jgi:transposase